MFFIYKKKNTMLSEKVNTFLLRNNPAQQSRILILTFDLAILRSMLLPITYIIKDRSSFLLLYRFQSIRNYKMMASDLKFIVRSGPVHSLLLPTFGMRHILRILVLFRIPFHFISPGYGGTPFNKVSAVRTVRLVYALLYLNLTYKKLLSLI